jgi:DNA-binding CsgD family transcriptional regulator
MVTVADGEILGREHELALIDTFLAASAAEPTALVLAGDAGAGKSTLWHAAVAAARQRGFLVLCTRPTQAERGLAYVGLGDLFDGVLDLVLADLPTPRRRALEVVLLREEAGDVVDPRALGLAIRTALQLLARDWRLVVAIDDAQWLDDASSGALSFALRRVDTGNVMLLLTRRVEREAGPAGKVAAARPVGPEGALAAGEVQRLAVGPLSVEALHLLIRQRLGRTFARPTMRRLHQTAGGNPFYALELARSLDRAASDVPVPDSLAELVRHRLGALPAATRDALLVVAALGRPDRVLAAAAGVDEHDLGPAVLADVVELDEDVRFTHPLLSSTVYGDAEPDARRAVHGRLADVVRDPIASGRHLGLGPERVDEALARRLEEAASLALVRGAPAAAAELGEMAAERTPRDHADDARRRVLAAARDHAAAGATDRALALARGVVDEAVSPVARSEALVLLSEVHARAGGAGGARVAVRYAREALTASSGHPEVELRAHDVLASALLNIEGVAPAEVHARAAVRLTKDIGNRSLVARAIGRLASIRLEAGAPDALGWAERAVALARSSGDAAADAEAGMVLGEALLSLGRLDEARPILLAYQDWAAGNDESALAGGCSALVLLELRAGRWEEATHYAQRMRDLMSQLNPAGHEDEGGYGRLALVAAYRGDEAGARDHARKALENVERGNWNEGRRMVRSIIGLIDLWAGDSQAAVAQFDDVEAERRAAGQGGPTVIYRPGEHVEALLEIGRTDSAVGVLDRWAADAGRVGNAWELAEVLHSRGLVAAARGDLDAALVMLEGAVEQHQDVGDPFGRARALLVLGVLRRRRRQKRASREAIEEALAAFDALGADGWVARARAEMGRIGGRTREEGLTAAERRVAALVAEGRTNREVAAALFLGERTIETHLSHVYAKLGVRSRAELARTFQTGR